MNALLVSTLLSLAASDEATGISLRDSPAPSARIFADTGGAILPLAVTTATSAAAFFGMWWGLGAAYGRADGTGRTGLYLDFHVFPAVAVAVAMQAAGTLFLVPLGTWKAHQAAGGEGTYWSSVRGAAIGAGLGAVAGVIGTAMFMSDSRQSPGDASWLFALGLAATVAGPVIGIELSHASGVKLAAAPTNGGAMAGLSGSF